MRSLSLGKYGTLTYADGAWSCWEIAIPGGPVEVHLDGKELPPDALDRVLPVLDRFTELDAAARAYLQQHAPDAMDEAGELSNPSLFFWPKGLVGEFTVFYMGEDDDDDTDYGVDFQDYTPFDLSVGD